ncbi:hypothetical protein CerSpe_151530 [Prunus speciosa]
MSSGKCVKVVIINTKYVETDAMSFKDVVQKLTGKDSRVAYEMQEPNNVAKSQCFLRDQGINNYGGRTNVNVMESSNNTSCSVNGGKTTTMSQKRELESFKKYTAIMDRCELTPAPAWLCACHGNSVADPFPSFICAPSLGTWIVLPWFL